MYVTKTYLFHITDRITYKLREDLELRRALEKALVFFDKYILEQANKTIPPKCIKIKDFYFGLTTYVSGRMYAIHEVSDNTWPTDYFGGWLNEIQL